MRSPFVLLDRISMQTAATKRTIVKNRNVAILSAYILDQEASWCEHVQLLLAKGTLTRTSLQQISDGTYLDGHVLEGDNLRLFVSILCLLKVYNIENLEEGVFFDQNSTTDFTFFDETDLDEYTKTLFPGKTWLDPNLTDEEETDVLGSFENEMFVPEKIINEILENLGL